MNVRNRAFTSLSAAAVIAAFVLLAQAQNVKRVVIVKIDGLPGYYSDKFVKQRDPETGRSALPWFDEIFYKNGTRVPNFYTRGPSISGPSWGQLDTGQHMQIRSNVEYDRYTLHAYDYLNFFPYYLNYAFRKNADMPAPEVLDQLEIPIMADIFPYEKRYTSQQLYQRGNNWEVFGSGFVKLFPGVPGDFLDEWTLGLDFRKLTINQAERDIIGKLVKRPEIDYFDYYDVSFDHVSHHNNDTASRLNALKDIDRLIGRLWTAIQASSRADETALILLSDHGFNSEEKIYSQGFNLVKLFGSSAGGGHHVVTKRRLMLDYSIKGVYPLVPLIHTASPESQYLKGKSSEYPTALLDFDGNERATIHLRNSDLNTLHILLQELQREKLQPEIRAAATNMFFGIIDSHREDWNKMLERLNEELDALKRRNDAEQKIVDAQPKKISPEDIASGLDKSSRRAFALAAIDAASERDYRKYAATLSHLLELNRSSFNARKLRAEDLIAAGAMGDGNSVYQLQNYIVGVSSSGLSLGANNEIDTDNSFMRVDYFDLLNRQKVRNNVQRELSSRPVDFVAVRLPGDAISTLLSEDSYTTEDAVWIYGGADDQVLILTRTDRDGGQSYRYLTVSGLREDSVGNFTFQIREPAPGLPLRYFEDENFAVAPADRAAWLNEWHSETNWLRAVHKTVYSNALIGLKEVLIRQPLYDRDDGEISRDERLNRRFRRRQRDLTDPDLLIVANNHWNFDVRGFNPGGNHGSFFRVSTNSTFMIAGGAKTGIPRGLAVEEPYDGLSFMPTVLRLMGKIDDENRPNDDLKRRGFRNFPGRAVKEITSPE